MCDGVQLAINGQFHLITELRNSSGKRSVRRGYQSLALDFGEAWETKMYVKRPLWYNWRGDCIIDSLFNEGATASFWGDERSPFKCDAM